VKRKTTFVVPSKAETVASTPISGVSTRRAASVRAPLSQVKVTPKRGERTRVKKSASAKAALPSPRIGEASWTRRVSTTAIGVSVPKTAVCAPIRSSYDPVAGSKASVPPSAEATSPTERNVLPSASSARTASEEPVGGTNVAGGAAPARAAAKAAASATKSVARRRGMGPGRFT